MSKPLAQVVPAFVAMGMTGVASHYYNECQNARYALATCNDLLAKERAKPYTIAATSSPTRALHTILNHSRERTVAGDLADAEVTRQWHNMCAGAAGDPM